LKIIINSVGRTCRNSIPLLSDDFARLRHGEVVGRELLPHFRAENCVAVSPTAFRRVNSCLLALLRKHFHLVAPIAHSLVGYISGSYSIGFFFDLQKNMEIWYLLSNHFDQKLFTKRFQTVMLKKVQTS